MRFWFKELAARSTLLRSIYLLGIDCLGLGNWIIGRRYQALRWLLRGQKHSDPDIFSSTRKQRIANMLAASCFRDGNLLPLAKNQLLADYSVSIHARRLRALYGAYPLEDHLRLRHPRQDADPERQGDLIVLKSFNADTGEKGVILIKYNNSIAAFPAVFDLPAIVSEYILVLEPSWWGYQDVDFMLYLGSDVDVVILAQNKLDFEYIASLNTNLHPLRIGAGDWIDPDDFKPREASNRHYDVVMVSAWNPFKRHELMFRALASIRKHHGRGLRIALVGYPLGWTRSIIDKMIDTYQLQDQVEVFESIPHAEVGTIVANSRVFVLLSRREGANKSIYESMFCDTPVIVCKSHRGVNTDQITDKVGLLIEDDQLEQAMLDVIDNQKQFEPRNWALHHTGWKNTTKVLNTCLAEHVEGLGGTWTVAIADKKNAPSLRYAHLEEYRNFAPEFKRLERFLQN